MRLTAVAAFFVALSIGSETTPFAASWRCGNRLVVEGDTQERVVKICGAPTSRRVAQEEIARPDPYGGIRIRTITVETLTYAGRPGQFVRRLVFRDGILHRIEEGEYSD